MVVEPATPLARIVRAALIGDLRRRPRPDVPVEGDRHEAGLRLLRRANLDEEVGSWRELYAGMERSDRIERIEGMPNRPAPEWYGTA